LLALLVQHAGEIIPRDALLRHGDPHTHAGRPRTTAAQEAGRLCRPVHRNHFRHWIPVPAVPCATVLYAPGHQTGHCPGRLGRAATTVSERGVQLLLHEHRLTQMEASVLSSICVNLR
jgi:hypothetical protein